MTYLICILIIYGFDLHWSWYFVAFFVWILKLIGDEKKR